MLWNALQSNFPCHVIPNFPKMSKPAETLASPAERKVQARSMEMFLKKLSSNSVVCHYHVFEVFLSEKDFMRDGEISGLMGTLLGVKKNVLGHIQEGFTQLSSRIPNLTRKNVVDVLQDNNKSLINLRNAHREQIQRLQEFLATLNTLILDNNKIEAEGDWGHDLCNHPDLAEVSAAFDQKRAVLDDKRRAFFANQLSDTYFFLNEILRDLEGAVARESLYLDQINAASSQRESAELGHQTRVASLKQETDILVMETREFDAGVAANTRKQVDGFLDAYRLIEFCHC